MFPLGEVVALDEEYKVTIASDVGDGRDGIGIEVYYKNRWLLEVFRDDSKRTKEVTLFEKDVPLDIVEERIKIFKKEIPSEYED